MLLSLKMETIPASDLSCFFKNSTTEKVAKQKTVSVTFSCALFSFLFTHHDLAMQALVSFHRIQFRVFWIGTVRFGTS